jgi:hypothetical protein
MTKNDIALRLRILAGIASTEENFFVSKVKKADGESSRDFNARNRVQAQIIASDELAGVLARQWA